MITEERIMDIIIGWLMDEKKEITKESNFVDDLGLDSLDMIELKMIFEEEMGIEIPNEDIYEAKTVRELISYLKRK